MNHYPSSSDKVKLKQLTDITIKMHERLLAFMQKNPGADVSENLKTIQLMEQWNNSYFDLVLKAAESESIRHHYELMLTSYKSVNKALAESILRKDAEIERLTKLLK